MPDQLDDFPSELYGAPLEQARTLPGRWYADPEHHAREVSAVFHRRWIGVACADDVAAPGSYVSTSVAGVPVLVTRDDAAGMLRAFLNVCRHRGSPLAAGCGHARALSCPYHGWVYRLDGSLARAGGVGHPVGFDLADFGLRAVQVTTFARSVLVNLDAGAAAFDPGPLADGVEPYGLDEMELGERTRYEGRFNWKVLLENYCENYHTPFVHSQLPTNDYEYPIAVAGPAVIAWDRPLSPRDRSERALHDHRPGESGWAAVAEVAARRFVQQRHVPRRLSERRHLVLRRLRSDVPAVADWSVHHRRRAGVLLAPDGRRRTASGRPAATKHVVEQDLAMCEAIQRTYDAGLSADGVLSTEHESGVAHVHQLLLGALSGR